MDYIIMFIGGAIFALIGENFIISLLKVKYRVIQFQDDLYGIERQRIGEKPDYKDLNTKTVSWINIDSRFINDCKSEDIALVCNELKKVRKPLVREIKCK